MLDGFVTAARRGDSAAANALVSTRDQSFVGRAAVWAANVQRVPWSQLTWTAEAAQVPVSDGRQDILGDRAWVQQVTLTWALPGESRPAVQEVWLTFVDETTSETSDGRVTRLAGDVDSPAATTPTPIWLQQPVQLLRAGSVLVLTNAEKAQTWLRQASAAQRAVAARVGPADRDRDGVLVVEVPQSRAVFERVLGVAAGSYTSIAAAAWPMAAGATTAPDTSTAPDTPGTSTAPATRTAPDTSTAPIHVVVNPEASRRLSALGRNVLLTHEAVHVATRSPGSPAPTWTVEGYADQIAYDAYPVGSEPAAKTVRESVREHGAPRDWPDEDDFAPDAKNLDLSYDLAWSAARSIADAYGDGALNRFYAALESGGSVSHAAEVIDSSEKALRKRWRSDLEAMAGR